MFASNASSGFSSAGSSSSTQQQQQQINVKVFFKEDIRRLALPEPSWGRLKQRLAEIFHFVSTTSFLVKWKDEEGDFIALDSDEELAQALSYTTDPQQLLRLYIFEAPAAAPVPARSLFLPGLGHHQSQQQQQFTSFFTHATPYSSFSTPAYPPPRGLAPTQPALLPDPHPFNAAPSKESGDAAPNPASPEMATPGAVAVGGGGALAPMVAAHLFAAKLELKEQWKHEKKALKEQKYLCGNKEEWKQLKKEQKKNLKMAKTSHKLMAMERVFDPQDPKDHKKLFKLQQKQYKTTARALYARFVKHVSIPDGSEMAPNMPFTKTWRFRNEGTLAWPQEVMLMFISKINGDQMGAPEFVPVNKIVMPGDEVDVSVEMVSPSRAGHYQGYFRLCYGPKKFGQRVWVKINVFEEETQQRPTKQTNENPTRMHQQSTDEEPKELLA